MARQTAERPRAAYREQRYVYCPRYFRAAAYAALVDSALPPDTLAVIREATNANLALGSERCAAEIAAALGRRVTPGQRGRPRKAQEAEG